MRFQLDPTWMRPKEGRTVLAGSPLRLFRISGAGTRVVERVERGDDVAPSALVDRLLDSGAIHPMAGTASTNRTMSLTTRDVTVVTPQLGGATTTPGRLTVDDGSTPPIPGAALRLDVNRGPAAARNAGRRLVTTELIAFVDADVDIGEDWLVPLLAHFDDERVGLVAPRVLGEPGTSLDLGMTPARIRSGTRVSYVPGAAMLVRTTAFDDVGGFDERLRFGEDVDFVWRLDEAGWRCRYEPAAAVWHRPRPTWIERVRQQVGYGSSAAPLALRHPDALAPFRANGWSTAGLIIMLLGHPIAAGAVAIASATALILRLRDVPPGTSFELALRGHALSVRQLGAAVRRAWWPLVLVTAVVSRRARWLGLAAVLASPRTALRDVSYGWGVWAGMLDRRTIRPILPKISPWPARRRRRPAAGSG